LQPNDTFLSYNIQFVFEYYRIEKKKDSVCFQCCASSCRRARFLQLFKKKFVQSPQSPAFIQKFLTKFLCSITFKNVQIFYKNSILFAETHVYIKSLTSNRRLLQINARSVFK